MADDAGSLSGWSALFAAVATGTFMSLRTWWKTKSDARKHQHEESSAVTVARITSDSQANERLLLHLTTEIEQMRVDKDEIEQERDKLQERNTRLARMLALTTAHNNILTRELVVHDLSVPTLPIIDEGLE